MQFTSCLFTNVLKIKRKYIADRYLTVITISYTRCCFYISQHLICCFLFPAPNWLFSWNNVYLLHLLPRLTGSLYNRKANELGEHSVSFLFHINKNKALWLIINCILTGEDSLNNERRKQSPRKIFNCYCPSIVKIVWILI